MRRGGIIRHSAYVEREGNGQYVFIIKPSVCVSQCTSVWPGSDYNMPGFYQ